MSRVQFWSNAASGVLSAIAVAILVFVWAANGPTGPGCPGDPEWLGPCSEVQP